MQVFRKYTLVVCLSAAIALTAAASGMSTAPRRHGSLDGSIITRILEFFGIALQSRLSTPPGSPATAGDGELESRISIPPGSPGPGDAVERMRTDFPRG